MTDSSVAFAQGALSVVDVRVGRTISFGAEHVRQEFAQTSAHLSGIACDGIGGEE